jgi:hypothetical protein
VFREFADEPVRLQRVLEPGLRPTRLQASLDDVRIYFLSVKIEQGQFPARLTEPAPQVQNLMYGWKIDLQTIVIK